MIARPGATETELCHFRSLVYTRKAWRPTAFTRQQPCIHWCVGRLERHRQNKDDGQDGIGRACSTHRKHEKFLQTSRP